MTLLNPFRFAAAGSSTAYDDEVTSDSPIRYWKLDESSGTTADDDVGSNDGTYFNTPTLGLSGPGDPSGGVSFDDANDEYVEGPVTLGTTQAQSHELWFNYATDIDNGSSAVRYFAGDRTSEGNVTLGAATGALTDEVVTILRGDRTAFKGFTIPSGWNHMVLTYSGTRNGWVFYLNGSSTGTKFKSGQGALGLDPVSDMWLSQVDLGGTMFYSSFSASRWAIYDVELTSTQVSDHYNAATVS